jgi:hypothetical protein
MFVFISERISSAPNVPTSQSFSSHTAISSLFYYNNVESSSSYMTGCQYFRINQIDASAVHENTLEISRKIRSQVASHKMKARFGSGILS